VLTFGQEEGGLAHCAVGSKGGFVFIIGQHASKPLNGSHKL
jgi:hypothetical protein